MAEEVQNAASSWNVSSRSSLIALFFSFSASSSSTITRRANNNYNYIYSVLQIIRNCFVVLSLCFVNMKTMQLRGIYVLVHLRQRDTHRPTNCINQYLQTEFVDFFYLPPTVDFNSLSTFRSSLNSVDFSAYLKCTV